MDKPYISLRRTFPFFLPPNIIGKELPNRLCIGGAFCFSAGRDPQNIYYPVLIQTEKICRLKETALARSFAYALVLSLLG
ncbi:Hypothetical protein Minf_1700 [Methylacidiphilum infernorum V4]|uniref:Uncharacterized protein n=1 Tax=Methylacidiphilum infernorum (isolate V4) TaxID=481448 RepID=B3DWU1_METI4|nr:Hypothetical protein Minf_1700 [Methylacidiphilum infernorum V4]